MQIEARGRTRRDRLSTLKSCLSSSYALPRHYILITYFINTKYEANRRHSSTVHELTPGYGPK